MGYYSDVALALTGNGLQSYKDALASRKLSEKIRKEVTLFFSSADDHVQDANSECWKWTGVKWYVGDPEYFPEIDFIEELLTQIDEEDYRFLRIGEDVDDIETRGLWLDDPFGLTLARELVLDMG